MSKTLLKPSRQLMTKSIITADDVPVLTIGRMTQPELQARLEYFSRRAHSLCGMIAVNEKDASGNKTTVLKPIGEHLSNWFKALLNGSSDPAQIAERNEFLHKVQNGDAVANAQFCAARLENFNNFLSAQLDWINQYAEVVTLKDDEWPAEQNSTKQEITCFYVGEDGTPKMQKIRKEDPEQRIQLRFITTPVVRLKENDIYRGSVIDAALQTITMSFDLANKTQYEFITMLKANAFQTAWSFANAKKQRWPFITNSYIDQNNLPAGNDITVTGASGATYFDFATLDEIIDYAARWDNLSPEGNLRPTGRIRLPSSHLRKFGSGVTPSGATSNKIADSLLENGWTGINYRRVDWVFIPDSTLSASENICYPEFNFKPARYFTKPSQDKEVVRTGQQSQRLFEANEQERQIAKVYGASINTSQLWKIARFKYKV